jgi:hypothetical protein
MLYMFRNQRQENRAIRNMPRYKIVAMVYGMNMARYKIVAIWVMP